MRRGVNNLNSHLKQLQVRYHVFPQIKSVYVMCVMCVVDVIKIMRCQEFFSKNIIKLKEQETQKKNDYFLSLKNWKNVNVAKESGFFVVPRT